MKTKGKAAASWEPAFFAFLRRELVPSPARWRGTMRLTLLSVLGMGIAECLHLPEAEYLLIFVFAVNLPDAWPSLRKAWLRGIGVIFGSVAALLTCLVFAQQPWALLVIQSLAVGATLYFSRTTTAPYAVTLAGFAFVLLTPSLQAAPESFLTTALWRATMSTVGAVGGTLAQLWIWPDNPEQRLLEGLAERLRTVAELLERSGDGTVDVLQVIPTTSVQLATQLDLLASVEARSPWLRRHHAEQVRVVTELERILLDALQLAQVLNETGPPPPRDIRHRLAALSAAFRQRADAWERDDGPERLPASESGIPSPITGSPGEKVDTLLADLEQSLQRLDGALAFLRLGDRESTAWRQGIEPVHEPLYQQKLLKPADARVQADALRFGLKGALAATVCYLIYIGLDWPGIATCVAMCLLVAQSSVGAGYSRSLLIFCGAILGGAAAFVIIVFFVPNLFGLSPFLVLTGSVFFLAAWIASGTGRTAYLGVQMALTFALVLFATSGPTLSLAPAGDRLIGVLLGVTVMSLVDLSLWPNFAGMALRRRLRNSLRSLARLTTALSRSDWDAFGAAAHGVHLDLAAVLNLYSEWQLEFGRPTARNAAAQDRLLTLAQRIEDLFLHLLDLGRLRKTRPVASFPSGWSASLRRADETMTAVLEAWAEGTTSSRTHVGSDSLEAVARFPVPPVPDDLTRTMTDVNQLYLRLSEPLGRLESAVRGALAQASEPADAPATPALRSV